MIKVYFDNTLISDDSYVALSNDYKLFTDNFYLGSTAANTFKLSVAKTAVTTQPSEVKITDDTNTYYLIVDKITDEKNFYIYDLVDKLVLFNFNYDAKPLIDLGTTTLSDILIDMCTQAGVTLDETLTLINDIEVTWYDNTLLARDYLSFIAELQGGYARILDNGKLTIVKHKMASQSTLQIDNCEDFLLGEKKEITRVVYDNGIVKYEYGNETGNTLYINPNNVYITDTTIVENIYDEVVGLEFYLLQTGRCQLDPSVRAGDIITFTDGVNSYLTIASYSSSFGGGNWLGNYSLNVASKQQEETQVIGLNTEVKSIKTIIDRTNASLSIVANEVEGLTDFIVEVSTTGNYVKLTGTPVSNGAISNLSIKGFNLMGLYPGMAHPSEYTYPGALSFYTLVFDTVNTFNATPKYVYIQSPIPLQKIGSVYDEISIVNNQVSIIQRIGYSGTNPIVLSTPIVHDVGGVLIPTFDGDTYIKVLYFDNLIFASTYMQKNALTNVFATQLESSAILSITNDRINSKVSKDGVISEINQSPEQIAISANKIALEGYTTINNGFSVDLDGNATMQDATIYGDIYIPSTTSKVIGNLGIFGALHISQKGLIGQEFSSISGGYAFSQNVIKFVFYIPETFTVSRAYIVLKQTKTKHIPVMADSVDGKLTTVNLYSGTTERTWIVSDYWDAQAAAFEDNNDLGTIITSAFNNYTAPNIYSNTVLSADISSSITTGINNLFINNGSVTELFEAASYPDPTSLINARLPKSCYAYADLIIYGYDKT